MSNGPHRSACRHAQCSADIYKPFIPYKENNKTLGAKFYRPSMGDLTQTRSTGASSLDDRFCRIHPPEERKLSTSTARDVARPPAEAEPHGFRVLPFYIIADQIFFEQLIFNDRCWGLHKSLVRRFIREHSSQRISLH